MSFDGSKLDEYRGKLQTIVLEGEKSEGVELAQDALNAGLSPLDFFQQVVSPVVHEVGEQFARLEIFLPELMRSGMVIKEIQAQVLEPAIKKGGGTSGAAGKVVIGTCQGDIHDIGKNMVALMLQVNGFLVTDLGTDVSPASFIEAAKRENADIIAMSALLTPSVPYIRDTVEFLSGYGLRKQFAVIAGGAAVTRQWAEENGIDSFGEDAVEAVDACRKIMQSRKG